MPDEPSMPTVPSPRTPHPSVPCVLLKHGEIFLKGRNRHLFTERLHDNLRRALRGIGGSTWIKSGHNVTVLGGEVSQDVLVERARRVIGFNSVEPALRVPEHRRGHHAGGSWTRSPAPVPSSPGSASPCGSSAGTRASR